MLRPSTQARLSWGQQRARLELFPTFQEIGVNNIYLKRETEWLSAFVKHVFTIWVNIKEIYPNIFSLLLHCGYRCMDASPGPPTQPNYWFASTVPSYPFRNSHLLPHTRAPVNLTSIASRLGSVQCNECPPPPRLCGKWGPSIWGEGMLANQRSRLMQTSQLYI